MEASLWLLCTDRLIFNLLLKHKIILIKAKERQNKYGGILKYQEIQRNAKHLQTSQFKHSVKLLSPRQCSVKYSKLHYMPDPLQVKSASTNMIPLSSTTKPAGHLDVTSATDWREAANEWSKTSWLRLQKLVQLTDCVRV